MSILFISTTKWKWEKYPVLRFDFSSGDLSSIEQRNTAPTTADNALRQIDERGYASKYALDGRPVVKVGLAFSSKERNIAEWKSE